MKEKIFILCVFFASCNIPDSSCVYTSDKLLRENHNKVFGTQLLNGEVSEFRDKGKDSIKAGYYTFYKNGKLKSYQFFVNMQTYIYDEEYDPKGNIIKMEGSPFVFNTAKFINADSVFIKMYFFSLNKSYQDLSVKTINNTTLTLKLQDDTLFSNMKHSSFGINFKGHSNIFIYINGFFENLCSGKVESIKDTIALQYDK